MQTAQVIPFHFETREIRTLLIDDQPWFVAADVAAALGYRMAADMTRNLDDDERGTQIVRTPSKNQHGDFGTAEQEMLVINESGLYSAILRSRKAEARRFKKWVTAEVLPAIRKHGRYEDTSNRMATLIGETIGTDGFHMLGSLIKGKVASLPSETRRRATMKIWSQTHAAFGVRTAADIPAEQLDAARNFIAAYAMEGEWLPKSELKGFTIDDSHAKDIALLLHSIAWINRRWHQGISAGVKGLNFELWGSTVEHMDNAIRSARHLDVSMKSILDDLDSRFPLRALRPEDCDARRLNA